MQFSVIIFITGSMLHAMFSGRFDTKPSADGSYFIDRDGTHFRYILNYLRTGELIVPDDKIVRREILAEAKFYQVEGIINELVARSFKDSVILPSDQRLLYWLKDNRHPTPGNLFPVLLYRASRDGWTGANFHSRCDNKGPTVTVVSGCRQHRNHETDSKIFGGYTEEQWEGGGKSSNTDECIQRAADFLRASIYYFSRSDNLHLNLSFRTAKFHFLSSSNGVPLAYFI